MLASFLSASETAFSSANLIRLRQYMEEGRKGAKVAYELMDCFEDVLLVILVSSNVVAFSAAGIATIIGMETFGETGALVATFVVTIVMIVFGEIIPKSYARENSEKLLLKISSIYRFMLAILKPVIVCLKWIKSVFGKKAGMKEEEPSVTGDELNVIIDTMEEEGVLEEEEVEMLQGVLDLSQTFVKNIMTPRVDVTSINIESGIDEVKEIFLAKKYSRVPIFQDSHDNVVGVLSERDLFAELICSEDASRVEVACLMKEPVYVSSSMRVSSLLEKLRFEKQHMAIVIDEYGAAAGVVTLEDVLEEVVGEIYDEHDDEEQQLILKKSDNVYEVLADVGVDEVLEHTGVEIDCEDDASTLGSWIYSKLEDIPSVGDVYMYGDAVKFTIISVEDRRIKRIKIQVLDGVMIDEE